MDTVINYDFTNQKLRYFGSTTIFNDSSKPTFHFEEIYLYNEVRIEADGVTLIHMLLTIIFVGCFMRPWDWQVPTHPHI